MSGWRIDDPRALPKIPFGPEQGLAPDPTRLAVAAIRQRFAAPAPWQPEQLDERPINVDAAPRMAAVLIPLLERAHGTSLLLTRRSQGLRHHSGQIAFPGGGIDPGESAQSAALRETEEEIGLAPQRIDILGALPPLRTATGFDIAPFVAEVRIDTDVSALRPAPEEVAEIFEVPLQFLMDPRNHQRRLFRWHEGGREISRSVLAMSWQPDPAAAADDEYFIWGVTAEILRNFYRFLAA